MLGGGGVCVVCVARGRGGGGVGGGVLGGNCSTGAGASISKPTPFIYLAFEKNGPIRIIDRLKC